VDDQLTVVILTNLDGARPNELTHRVQDFYIPELTPMSRNQTEPESQERFAPDGEDARRSTTDWALHVRIVWFRTSCVSSGM